MADHWFSMGYVTYEKKNYCTCNEKAKIRPQELHRESGFGEGAQTDTVREKSHRHLLQRARRERLKHGMTGQPCLMSLRILPGVIICALAGSQDIIYRLLMDTLSDDEQTANAITAGN